MKRYIYPSTNYVITSTPQEVGKQLSGDGILSIFNQEAKKRGWSVYSNSAFNLISYFNVDQKIPFEEVREVIAATSKKTNSDLFIALESDVDSFTGASWDTHGEKALSSLKKNAISFKNTNI